VTVLVDAAVWPFRGRRWAHLVSDSSVEELRRFADELGLDRRLFQGDHYDITAEWREEAIARGAQPVESRELVRRLRASGLRLSAAQRRARSQNAAALRATHEWFEHNSGWAPPDGETLAEWLADGVCRCPDECLVTPSSICEHGLASWDLVVAALDP
jgi:hypothetical protein